MPPVRSGAAGAGRAVAMRHPRSPNRGEGDHDGAGECPGHGEHSYLPPERVAQQADDQDLQREENALARSPQERLPAAPENTSAHLHERKVTDLTAQHVLPSPVVR
ncbi:hypothetical protein GCM10010486_15290 [Nonomuraea roseoviolacea subsp. carminata]